MPSRFLRHASRRDIDLVVLASLDSDLIPALDEVVGMGERVKTFSWWSPDDWSFEMHLSDRLKRIWNTRLGEQEFFRCIDRTAYT